MSLTLVVPGLNWPHPMADGPTWPVPDCPALHALRRFGRHHDAAIPTLSALYGQLIGADSLLVQAKRQLGLPESQAAFFASPLTQRLDLHSMSVLAGASLAIQASEARQLCADLSQFLADSGWHWHPYQADLWLVCCDEAPSWQPAPVLDVVGQVAAADQTNDAPSMALLQIQTEIQMFLHNHTINTARQRTGQPTLNGVWFWRDLAVSGSRFADAAIARDNGLLPALPQQQPVPYDYAACQRWQEEAGLTAVPETVLVLEDLLLPSVFGDIWAWQDALVDLDRRFWAPAWAALRSGSLKRLTLLCHGHKGQATELTVAAKAQRAFWRRSPPFQGQL